MALYNDSSLKDGDEGHLGSWAINAEFLGTGSAKSVTVNILNATKSPFTPPGGFTDPPKEMAEMLKRLYIASHVQLGGVVQNPGCKNCKKGLKECKRMTDSQVRKSELCGHCIRGSKKGCTEADDAEEGDGKDKKTPAKKVYGTRQYKKCY